MTTMYPMNPADETLHLTAKMVQRFIIHLFQCSKSLPVPPSFAKKYKLVDYIEQVLRTAMIPSLSSHVLVGALILLNRMKERYPAANSPTGHQLLVPALMISAKFLDDHQIYSNRAWTFIAQQSTSHRAINQMEREMCQHLDWDFNMNLGMLDYFRRALLEDFFYKGRISRKYPIHTTTRRPTANF